MHIRSLAEDYAEEEHEVPVGCVRRTDQHVFWNVRESPVNVPAEQTHDGPREKMKDVTKNGSVENGSFHV